MENDIRGCEAELLTSPQRVFMHDMINFTFKTKTTIWFLLISFCLLVWGQEIISLSSTKPSWALTYKILRYYYIFRKINPLQHMLALSKVVNLSFALLAPTHLIVFQFKKNKLDLPLCWYLPYWETQTIAINKTPVLPLQYLIWPPNGSDELYQSARFLK